VRLLRDSLLPLMVGLLGDPEDDSDDLDALSDPDPDSLYFADPDPDFSADDLD